MTERDGEGPESKTTEGLTASWRDEAETDKRHALVAEK